MFAADAAASRWFCYICKGVAPVLEVCSTLHSTHDSLTWGMCSKYESTRGHLTCLLGEGSFRQREEKGGGGGWMGACHFLQQFMLCSIGPHFPPNHLACPLIPCTCKLHTHMYIFQSPAAGHTVRALPVQSRLAATLHWHCQQGHHLVRRAQQWPISESSDPMVVLLIYAVMLQSAHLMYTSTTYWLDGQCHAVSPTVVV